MILIHIMVNLVLKANILLHILDIPFPKTHITFKVQSFPQLQMTPFNTRFIGCTFPPRLIVFIVVAGLHAKFIRFLA